MNQIKFCIWDVGQVIYKYSLEPLHKYLERKTSDKTVFQEKVGKFSYNDYMNGLLDWDQFCKNLCDFYLVKFSEDIKLGIKQALYAGIGEYFVETRLTQEYLLSVGVENCILSNALPILESGDKNLAIILPQNVFVSGKIGLLKPDKKIYQAVLDKLNCQPNEVIFVDDKLKNVAAAKELGINGIVFNPHTIESDIKEILFK